MLLLLFILISCSSGDSGTETPEIEDEIIEIIVPEVADFVLQNSEQLIANLNTELEGLSFDVFIETSYLAILSRNDQNAISSGDIEILDPESASLQNISDEFTLQTIALQSAILSKLQEFERSTLTQTQQLTYDIYLEYLQSQIDNGPYILFSYPATYGFFGWPGSTENFFTNVFVIDSLHAAEVYVSLLNQIARRFEQIETMLDSRAQVGIIEPQITLSFSRDNVLTMATSSPQQTSYYIHLSNSLNNISNLSNEEQSRLLDMASKIMTDKVLPAYASLGTKMTNLVASAPSEIGFGQFIGGEDFYAHQLGFFTSSDLSAAEVHQMGLDQLALIHQQMRAHFATLGYPESDSIAQAYSKVNQDAGIIPAVQVKAKYEELIADAYTRLPEAFSVLPEQEVIVVGGTSGGYYIRGSEDGSRPGAFYANTASDNAYTTMPTLAYHEAVPGHHLQLALAQELDLPAFQRNSNFTSFIEGWGLYSERLAFDLGWYENDIYGDLGRLQFEAMRAARLVVDTGIHVMDWSYDEANNFHIENVGFGGSIARYSVWPGQATAYSVGMLKILELRDQAQSQLGEQFDIRAFHQVVIGSGSMPLNVLEQQIELYIADTLAND